MTVQTTVMVHVTGAQHSVTAVFLAIMEIAVRPPARPIVIACVSRIQANVTAVFLAITETNAAPCVQNIAMRLADNLMVTALLVSSVAMATNVGIRAEKAVKAGV